jgi:anaerobic magnesium-protoporphyrin IX monomethyl ester cyclase
LLLSWRTLTRTGIGRGAANITDRSMADILFTHSYFLRFDPKEYRAMMPYPPLGTLYAASVVREAGYSVALFDSMLAENENAILSAIDIHHPRVVIIYDDDFNYLTKMCLTRMRDAAFAMSRLARQKGCTVIIHGSDAVDHLDKYFQHDADFVICGEGEQTLVETLNCVVRGEGTIEAIKGIAYKQDSSIVRTPDRPVRKELDVLPFPARDLVDVELYRSAWKRAHGYFSVNMVTTRGCPFHCNWCAKPIYGQVYNSRSPENVAAEMKLLKETLRPDHLWFCDDIFGLKPGWIGRFREAVIKADAAIPFKCLARVDLLLKENAIDHLRAAGCETVWVGAESGSQNILDAMDKGTTVGQIYEASARLKAAGIRVGFFLQYGYPGETRDDIDLTLRMVKECLPDEIGVSVSYPLPGTTFYENVKAQMDGKHNWVDSQDLAMMFAGTFDPDFYRVLHKVTHKRFRMALSRQLLRSRLARPGEFKATDFRTMAAALYHRVTLPRLEREMNRLSLLSR